MSSEPTIARDDADLAMLIGIDEAGQPFVDMPGKLKITWPDPAAFDRFAKAVSSVNARHQAAALAWGQTLHDRPRS